MAGDVNALFTHGFNNDGVDGDGRGRASGANLNSITCEVSKEPSGHLRAAGVMDANEQDTRLVGHDVSFGLLGDRGVVVLNETYQELLRVSRSLVVFQKRGGALMRYLDNGYFCDR